MERNVIFKVISTLLTTLVYLLPAYLIYRITESGITTIGARPLWTIPALLLPFLTTVAWSAIQKRFLWFGALLLSLIFAAIGAAAGLAVTLIGAAVCSYLLCLAMIFGKPGEDVPMPDVFDSLRRSK